MSSSFWRLGFAGRTLLDELPAFARAPVTRLSQARLFNIRTVCQELVTCMRVAARLSTSIVGFFTENALLAASENVLDIYWRFGKMANR